MNDIRLVELDMSKSVGHEHPDIVIGNNYIVKIHGSWFLGTFSRQWYGLNFFPWGTSGIQFDAPGTNSSSWERIIEFNEGQLSD